MRQLAADVSLHVAGKKDSVGICFVGKRRFSQFISNYIPCERGPFVCVESGMHVGTHRRAARPYLPEDGSTIASRPSPGPRQGPL